MTIGVGLKSLEDPDLDALAEKYRDYALSRLACLDGGPGLSVGSTKCWNGAPYHIASLVENQPHLHARWAWPSSYFRLALNPQHCGTFIKRRLYDVIYVYVRLMAAILTILSYCCAWKIDSTNKIYTGLSSCMPVLRPPLCQRLTTGSDTFAQWFAAALVYNAHSLGQQPYLVGPCWSHVSLSKRVNILRGGCKPTSIQWLGKQESQLQARSAIPLGPLQGSKLRFYANGTWFGRELQYVRGGTLYVRFRSLPCLVWTMIHPMFCCKLM